MRRVAAAVLLLALAGVALAAEPVIAEPVIDEPRSYGHVIGDVLTRVVRLELPAGRRLDADGLPRPGRIDAWLELHSVEQSAAGGSLTLRLNYQAINIGAGVVTTVLPALKLPLAGGAAGEAIELPDWPVHLSPLTGPFAVARGALEAMQPDIEPVREPLAPLLQRLALYAALLGLAALPALLRRFPQLAFWRRRAPFLAAWRDLDSARRRQAAQETTPDATQRALARLHAAFDAAAGGAVFAQRLEALYAAQPALRAASDEIAAFFAASRDVFFAQGDPGAWTPARVRALALRLAQLERGA